MQIKRRELFSNRNLDTTMAKRRYIDEVKEIVKNEENPVIKEKFAKIADHCIIRKNMRASFRLLMVVEGNKEPEQIIELGKYEVVRAHHEVLNVTFEDIFANI